MSRLNPPHDLTSCEIKPAARGSRRCYLFHRASGWISRPLSRQMARQLTQSKPKEASACFGSSL